MLGMVIPPLCYQNDSTSIQSQKYVAKVRRCDRIEESTLTDEIAQLTLRHMKTKPFSPPRRVERCAGRSRRNETPGRIPAVGACRAPQVYRVPCNRRRGLPGPGDVS